MIEVVFSDSVLGSMKVAKNYDSKQWMKGAVGYIGSKPSEDVRREMYEGEALGGSSADVIGILFWLDIGALVGGVESDERKAVLKDMTMGPIGMIEDPDEAFNEFWSRAVQQLALLKEKASQGEKFRLWYSDTPSALCGYYFVCSILQKFDCEVVAVKLPKCVEKGPDGVIHYKSWGEVHPGKFYDFVKYETHVSPVILKSNGLYWKQLEVENSGLRASINGELRSVSEDFYDGFIRRHLPTEPTKMGRIIGDVLGREGLKVTDWWIRRRIRWMITTGEVVVVKGGDNEYGFHIKKTSK